MYEWGKVVSHNVSAGVIVSEDTLALQQVRREGSGRYQCSASNVEGDTLSSPVNITIKCESDRQGFGSRGFKCWKWVDGKGARVVSFGSGWMEREQEWSALEVGGWKGNKSGQRWKWVDGKGTRVVSVGSGWMEGREQGWSE
ncbi:hypothetical protein Pcinc_042713 [Petrolisthes cinctipes]|uniref:Ig-like domain-containing protein n=1 Tax=Petrolisthes cinctipes TaxID=88211 RepID=A0AAE1BH51_PETCI|nr:hypothetical protein Pcinc_042713 [Petrolisthes cinctipes]